VFGVGYEKRAEPNYLQARSSKQIVGTSLECMEIQFSRDHQIGTRSWRLVWVSISLSKAIDAP